MRIAIVTQHSPLSPSSAADWSEVHHLPSLARALAKLGHRVTIYARSDRASGPRTAILGSGVSVEYVKAGPAKPLSDDELATHMPQFAAHLAKVWRLNPPDVAHAYGWTSGLAAIGGARGLDVPVVLSLGSLASVQRRHLGTGDISQARMRLESTLARSAAAVLAATTDEASELARMGVPKSAIAVVPCGIDVGSFGPDGKSAARGKRSRLVAVASPDRLAGADVLVRALAGLPDAELIIVGGPTDKHLPKSGGYRELATLATELGVRRRVRFAGQLAGDELVALLRSADVLVSASPYEPSGLAAVSAMACGTPAVVSAVGGHMDAVIDGTTGLLVQPGQPGQFALRLRRLLGTPALLQAYGIAAADRAASRYAWPRIGAEAAAVYERCVRPAVEVAEEPELETESELVAAGA
jgi:glycosyltransferase involved in cell wall biosynthesis